MELRRMKLENIRPDPDQPRKTFDDEKIEGLADTYRSEGQIVPIEVDEDGVIVTGERRWRAAKKAGLKELDVLVHTPENRLQRQLIEEFHRENIPDLERARAVRRLWESHNGTQTALGKQLGVGQDRISEYLAMTDDPDIEKAIDEGKVPGWKAVELKQALGSTERAKKYIESHEREDIRTLHREEDLRPVKRAPDRVKEAIARGEIDFEDTAPVVDLIPEEEEQVRDFVEELKVRKQAREFDEEQFREEAERFKEEGPKTTEVVDATRTAKDERTLKAVRAKTEEFMRIIPATILSIKDEDLKEEAVQAVLKVYQYAQSILEALGRYDITLADVKEAEEA